MTRRTRCRRAAGRVKHENSENAKHKNEHAHLEAAPLPLQRNRLRRVPVVHTLLVSTARVRHDANGRSLWQAYHQRVRLSSRRLRRLALCLGIGVKAEENTLAVIWKTEGVLLELVRHGYEGREGWVGLAHGVRAVD